MSQHEPKIGQKISVTEPYYRDAIHIAVTPVIADCQLWPGNRIKISRQDGDVIHVKLAEVIGEAIGIVDPFLAEIVRKGERFHLFLYPRTITSLRHSWSHPAFTPAPEAFSAEDPRVKLSKGWVENYAYNLGFTYDDFMAAAKKYLDTQDDRYGGRRLVGGRALQGVYTDPAFWTHYEVITGEMTAGRKDNFFSCAC